MEMSIYIIAFNQSEMIYVHICDTSLRFYANTFIIMIIFIKLHFVIYLSIYDRYGKFLMRLLSSQNLPRFLNSVSVKELTLRAEKIEKNEKKNEIKKNEKDSLKRQLQKNKFRNLNKDVGARGEWSILEVSLRFFTFRSFYSL